MLSFAAYGAVGFAAAPMRHIAVAHARPAMPDVRSHFATQMSIVAPEFGAVDFGTAASSAAATDSGDGSVFGSILFVICAVVAFNFAQGFIKGAHAALEEEDSKDAEPRPEAKSFGWLQADLRMPLPSWEELQESCYRIGEHQGHTMYECFGVPAHTTAACRFSCSL